MFQQGKVIGQSQPNKPSPVHVNRASYRNEIMKHVLLSCCCLLVTLPAGTIAQQTTPTLAAFFEQRLANMPPPAYEALLRVIDPIASSDPRDIAAALPFLSAALRSTK